MSVTKEKNTKQNKTKSEAWAVINKYHRLFHICFGVIKLILIVDIESYKVAPDILLDCWLGPEENQSERGVWKEVTGKAEPSRRI